MQFLKPDASYKDSYADALEESFRSIPATSAEITLIRNDFAAWLRESEDLLSGPEWWQKDAPPITLPDGRVTKRVPCTTFWLIVKDRFIGEVAVRHTLSPALEQIGGHIGYNVRASERGKGYGTALLAQGLNHAATLGIDPALITCNDDNIASIRLIEKAGGKLADILAIPGRSMPHRHYWVPTAGTI